VGDSPRSLSSDEDLPAQKAAPSEAPTPSWDNPPWSVWEGVAAFAAFWMLQKFVGAGLTLLRRSSGMPLDSGNDLFWGVTGVLAADAAVVLLLGAAVFAGGAERDRRAAAGLRLPTARNAFGALPWLLIGFGAYLLVGVAVAWFAEVKGSQPALQESALMIRDTTSTGDLVLACVMAVLVAPLAEELVFRVLLYLPMRKRLGAVPAVLIVSVVFSAMHVHAWGAAQLFVLSLILVAVIERTRSLWVPVLVHAAHNAVGIALLRLGVEGV